MMTSDMVESSSNQATLDNIQPEVMELLLEYMYKGVVNIPDEHLLSVTKASDYLDLQELKARCVCQALSVIDSSNVVSWYKLADHLNIVELNTHCLSMLVESFVNVSKGEDFLEIPFSEVCWCISIAQKADADTDDILEASINWVGYKSPTPREQIVGHSKNH